LTVGIIGAGTIVENVHLPVLLTTAGVNVAWVVDVDHTRASAIARAYGCRTVRLPADLAELPQADVYLLATPYGVRRPYFEALKKRSAAIYVEKPFAKTVAEHDWICALFAANQIADGYQKRSWGPAAYVKNVIDSGMFGRLKAVRFELGSPRTTGSRYGANPMLGGGGILMEIGCHGIDLALFLLEATDLHLKHGTMIVEDGYDLHTDGKFGIDCAKLGKVNFQIVASALQFTANSFVLEFENAKAAFSLFTWKGLHIETRSGSQFTLDPVEPLQPLTVNQNFHCHWGAFIEALQSGKPNHSNAAQSRLTAKALDQLYAVAPGSGI
jgi:predicted dehydrogenase